jgi:hypothetical protein
MYTYNAHIGSLETAFLRTCENFTWRNNISVSKVCRLVGAGLLKAENQIWGHNWLHKPTMHYDTKNVMIAQESYYNLFWDTLCRQHEIESSMTCPGKSYVLHYQKTSLTVRWPHSYMFVKWNITSFVPFYKTFYKLNWLAKNLINRNGGIIWQQIILQLEMLDQSFASKVSFKEGP